LVGEQTTCAEVQTPLMHVWSEPQQTPEHKLVGQVLGPELPQPTNTVAVTTAASADILPDIPTSTCSTPADSTRVDTN